MSIPLLCRHVSAFLDSLKLNAGSKLVLAYSGGVDSEVLAFGLSEYAKQHPELNYQLVYVHHGLSANADAWAKHCCARGQVYGLPVTIEYVSVVARARESLEAKARELRYLALAQHLGPQDYLLTAHHEDDQLETILLALKRGQGPKGLAAMGQIQPLAMGTHLRPLLDVSREHIEAFAKQQQLVHIEDESNQDDRFDRNFLRLDIIPRLTARWPSIANTASRSAYLCAEQQSVVDDVVAEHLPQWLATAAYSQQRVLQLDGFAALSPRWQCLLVRAFIESQGFALPSLVQLKELIQQMVHAKEDAKVRMRIGDYELRRFAKQLYVDSVAPVKTSLAPTTLTPHALAPLSQGQPVKIPLSEGQLLQLTPCQQGPRLRLPTLDEVVSIRYQLPGQLRCHPHYRSMGRELKKLLQESAVPPWLRAQVGFVFYNEQLVMAIGLWIEKAFCAQEGSLGIQQTLFKI